MKKEILMIVVLLISIVVGLYFLNLVVPFEVFKNV